MRDNENIDSGPCLKTAIAARMKALDELWLRSQADCFEQCVRHMLSPIRASLVLCAYREDFSKRYLMPNGQGEKAMAFMPKYDRIRDREQARMITLCQQFGAA